MAIDSPSSVSGCPLRSLEKDATGLSPEDFADRYGHGFLLVTAMDLRGPDTPARTEVQFDGESISRDGTATLSLLAFAIRRTGRSVGHLITLGRTGNNDVVLSDHSVSRFHAYLKEQDGRFQIQDAGSTNGTTVNRVPVPVQGLGAPADLKNGDNMRVGQVELTFLDADALREFVIAGAR